MRDTSNPPEPRPRPRPGRRSALARRLAAVATAAVTFAALGVAFGPASPALAAGTTTTPQDVIDAFAAGGTLTLDNDVEVRDNLMLASGKTLSIDLGTHTLTVIGSVGADGSFQTTDGNGQAGGDAITNNGTLTVSAGTLTALGGAGGAGATGRHDDPTGGEPGAGGDALVNTGALLVAATVHLTGGAGGPGGNGENSLTQLPGTYGGNGAPGGTGGTALDNSGTMVATGSVQATGGVGGPGGQGGDGAPGSADGPGGNGGNGGDGGNGGIGVSNDGTLAYPATVGLDIVAGSGGAGGIGGAGGAAGPGTASGTLGLGGLPGSDGPSTVVGSNAASVTLSGSVSLQPTAFVVYAATVGDAAASLTLLPQAWPARTGYAFAGWYTTASGGDPVPAATAASGQTIYAHWSPCTAATFTADFNGAASGSTVTLCGDLTKAAGSYPALSVASGKSVTLDLDGHSLSVRGARQQPGIEVPEGAALTVIDSSAGGTGVLNAFGGDNAAGIGGGFGAASGSITISGGTITAMAGSGGAGIGGGNSQLGGGLGTGGAVTINGTAIVSATGIFGGAGIGGGAYSPAAGTITIGGSAQVTANSSSMGAGIGGGSGRDATAVVITDHATVTAIGGESWEGSGGAAGIGGGGSSGSGGSGAAVTIGADATVTASSADGSATAIGGGNDHSGVPGPFGTLTTAGSLTIPAGNHLTIPAAASVPNSGTITNKGTISGSGALTGTGTVDNGGSIVHTVRVGDGQTVTDHHYLVSFDADGGSGAPGDITVYATTLGHAGLSVAGLATPTRSGLAFTGWHLGASGTGAVLADGTTLSTATSDGTAVPVTVSAAWGPLPAVVTSSLADGRVGASYSGQLAATGGTTPYTWSVTAGHLPTGLTLHPLSGIIDGTPRVGGSARFTVTVTDAYGYTATADRSLTITAPACTSKPFPDVAIDSPDCGAIAWVAGKGIASGYTDTWFHPERPVTRQTMAAFLYRYTHDGAQAPACTTAPFTDVPVGHPFCGAISWLAGQGVTAGYGDHTFHPTQAVTNQTMAALLYRLDHDGNSAPACTTAPFPDVPVGSQFCGAITWTADAGISIGDATGFHPADVVDRGSMAADLYYYDSFVTASAAS